jgi:hypothetical protein
MNLCVRCAAKAESLEALRLQPGAVPMGYGVRINVE